MKVALCNTCGYYSSAAEASNGDHDQPTCGCCDKPSLTWHESDLTPDQLNGIDDDIDSHSYPNHTNDG